MEGNSVSGSIRPATHHIHLEGTQTDAQTKKKTSKGTDGKNIQTDTQTESKIGKREENRLKENKQPQKETEGQANRRTKIQRDRQTVTKNR